MKNNSLSLFEYIRQLEKENINLKQENRNLKHKILIGYKEENTSLLQKELLIDSLRKELAKVKQENLMLVLVK
jgi:hypothetical protein